MHVVANGTRLWFDVDGPLVVPDGDRMRERPTIVLVHGGPGSYDHSYFKPYFARLGEHSQVVYLDLRGHGRSEWGSAEGWSFELCADDIRAFCDALEIERPVVYGHSMGGWIVLLYGARHPGHAAGLILQSTMARFDLERLVEGFRQAGGDDVAELARRSYGGLGSVTNEEWARVFAAFGPVVLDASELARRAQNPGLGPRGMDLMRDLDVLAELSSIDRPALVCVGELDAVTPVEAAREIVDALPGDVVRFEVVPRAGHFPWLDAPQTYWTIIEQFVADVAG